MTYQATIAEKILSRAAGKPVRAGDLAICTPDLAMGTDGSIPMALDYLRQMQTTESGPRHPEKLLFALDHYGPASGARALALQEQVRDYALRHQVPLVEVAQGIGHQIVLELGLAQPGRLLVGADSHAISYGAVNAFATGIGSSDLAGVMLCGQLWLKVPETLRIVFTGSLRAGVSAKDVALHLARTLGADGATYYALEFCGPGVQTLDMDDRIVLSNMSVELGAKAGIFPYDQTTSAWLASRSDAVHEAVSADDGARYIDTITVDLSGVESQLALPDRVDNVVNLADAPATRVDLVYLGTCTGGRIKDYREALNVLHKGGGVAAGVRLVVTPASESIRAEMQGNGMLDSFIALGAEIQPPGCGSCCGTCGMVPTDGMNVISTANRNFKGRMGNGKAAIFLASPAVCAAAAVAGSVGGGSSASTSGNSKDAS